MGTLCHMLMPCMSSNFANFLLLLLLLLLSPLLPLSSAITSSVTSRTLDSSLGFWSMIGKLISFFLSFLQPPKNWFFAIEWQGSAEVEKGRRFTRDIIGYNDNNTKNNDNNNNVNDNNDKNTCL